MDGVCGGSGPAGIFDLGLGRGSSGSRGRASFGAEGGPQDLRPGMDGPAREIEAVVKILRTDLPKTKVLILAIFARGENNDDPRRKVNEQANQIVCKLADGKMVHYLDINQRFLETDGTLTREIMPDLLHPREKGYTIWAEAMEPMVAKLMGEK